MQLCVRRGADAFLVKPLGSEEVRHIWQFVKELPEGSFKNDVEQARLSFTKSSPSPPDEEIESPSASCGARRSPASDVLAGALADAHIQERSVLVCAGYGSGSSGHSGTAASGAATTTGSVREADLSALPSGSASLGSSSSSNPATNAEWRSGDERRELAAAGGCARVLVPEVPEEAPQPPPGRGVGRRFTDESIGSNSTDVDLRQHREELEELGPVGADCKQQ